MKRGPGWGAALSGIAALAAAAGVWYFAFDHGPGAGADIPSIDPKDAEQVALGKKIYAAQCASCHGAKLEGEANWRTRKPDGTFPAPPHDESGHTWHHPDAILFAYTKFGGEKITQGKVKSAMPGFAGILTDAEIAAVLAFIKSRWPDEVRERQTRMSETYRQRQ